MVPESTIRRERPVEAEASGWFDVKSERAVRAPTRTALVFLAPLAKARNVCNHLEKEGGCVRVHSTC